MISEWQNGMHLANQQQNQAHSHSLQYLIIQNAYTLKLIRVTERG